MKRLAVLSDDLTGAMGAGLQLQKKGVSIKVIFGHDSLRGISRENEVIIIDTQSRNLPPKTAYSVVKKWCQKIACLDFQLIYKKIDSTLRGNIGKEFEAVLENGDFSCIALAPVLPFNNRITRDGVHYVNGKKLVESDLAKDPFAPIIESDIPIIIRQQGWSSHDKTDSQLINHGHFLIFLRTMIPEKRM